MMWVVLSDEGSTESGQQLSTITYYAALQVLPYTKCSFLFVGLAYGGKDIVFRFIIEYISLRDFGF
jgi:hypothetical protein